MAFQKLERTAVLRCSLRDARSPGTGSVTLPPQHAAASGLTLAAAAQLIPLPAAPQPHINSSAKSSGSRGSPRLVRSSDWVERPGSTTEAIGSRRPAPFVGGHSEWLGGGYSPGRYSTRVIGISPPPRALVSAALILERKLSVMAHRFWAGLDAGVPRAAAPSHSGLPHFTADRRCRPRTAGLGLAARCVRLNRNPRTQPGAGDNRRGDTVAVSSEASNGTV